MNKYALPTDISDFERVLLIMKSGLPVQCQYVYSNLTRLVTDGEDPEEVLTKLTPFIKVDI